MKINPGLIAIPRLILLLNGIICVGVLITGCLTNSPDIDQLHSDKYVVIQKTTDEDFTIIEGNPYPIAPEAPAPQIFDYDGSWGLTLQRTTFNDSLKIVYGNIGHIYSTLNYGSHLDIQGIYNLPKNTDSDLTILDAYQNGSVRMRYMNESIWLKAGEKWISPVTSTRVETNDFNSSFTNYSENGTRSEGINHVYFKVRYNATVSLENIGVFDKSKVVENERAYRERYNSTS